MVTSESTSDLTSEGVRQNPTRWHRLDEAVGLSRGDVLNAGASTVVGGVIGWALGAAFTGGDRRLELGIVVALAFIALLVCLAVSGFLAAYQREGREQVAAMSTTVNRLTSVVTTSIEGSAVLVPRDAIYPEMARCIRQAEEQVVVLTTYMYNWEEDRRTFGPVVAGNVPGVDEFYEAIYSCVADPVVEYLRIWQVPAERVSEAREKIMQEPRLAREIKLIESISPDNPERCRVRIIPEAMTASIILVDRKTMYLNVDVYDAERGMWLSPFMLMIKDARGRAFNDMKRVIVKLSS